jgi:hypothetical protein
MDNLRPGLAAFASVMESRLKENANRGAWRTLNLYYLVAAEKFGIKQAETYVFIKVKMK